MSRRPRHPARRSQRRRRPHDADRYRQPEHPPPPHAGPGGRHELGQNDLVDRRTIAAVVALVAETTGPIVELGAGTGALTVPLARLGRPITAIEIHPRRAQDLHRRLAAPDGVAVVVADALRHPYPRSPHVVVGNLPFHRTTDILRMLLGERHWTDAVLLVQWEVARRRTGVGGATMMTAQWWPWYDFTLHRRVPRQAFRPSPGVDGGLFTMHRRTEPLLEPRHRGDYQRFVAQVFTGRGAGLRAVLRGAGLDARRIDAVLRHHGIGARSLPRDLTPEQWVALFTTRHGNSGTPRLGRGR